MRRGEFLLELLLLRMRSLDIKNAYGLVVHYEIGIMFSPNREHVDSKDHETIGIPQALLLGYHQISSVAAGDDLKSLSPSRPKYKNRSVSRHWFVNPIQGTR